MASSPDWLQELYPTPWRISMRGARARILASNGHEFYNGMNKEKAVLIVIAVNALVESERLPRYALARQGRLTHDS